MSGEAPDCRVSQNLSSPDWQRSLRPGEARPHPGGCSCSFPAHRTQFKLWQRCPVLGRSGDRAELTHPPSTEAVAGRAVQDFCLPLWGLPCQATLGLRASQVRSFSLAMLLSKISYGHYRGRGCAKNLEWNHWAPKPQSAFGRSAGDHCQKHLQMALAIRNFLIDPNTPMDPTDGMKRSTTVRAHFSTY